MIAKLPEAETIVADKGYDSERVREQVEQQGAKAVIPRKRNSVKGNAERSLPQPALGGERLRPAKALPGSGISVRQAQEKLRKRRGHGLCLSLVTYVKRQQTLTGLAALQSRGPMDAAGYTQVGATGSSSVHVTVQSSGSLLRCVSRCCALLFSKADTVHPC
ncbi:transposase [Ectopseudomonas oleovorans]|uniref:transposase n=1 Tax=Ectopseudomonas oleovorans TaxID=301 RepID=UPI0037432B99